MKFSDFNQTIATQIILTLKSSITPKPIKYSP